MILLQLATIITGINASDANMRYPPMQPHQNMWPPAPATNTGNLVSKPNEIQARNAPAGLGEPSVFSNSIDASRVNNKDFLKELNISQTGKAMDEWFNTSPEAKALMNKFLINYGLMSPDNGGFNSGTPLPVPQHLLETVEESLVIHTSFKEFLRRLLETVQQYLTQCTLMIADTVIRLERLHKQVNATVENLAKSNSAALKNNYIKQYLDLKSDFESLHKKYEQLKAWKHEVEEKIKMSL